MNTIHRNPHTSEDEVEKEARLIEAVIEGVSRNQKKNESSMDNVSSRYITLGQGILGSILTVVILIGMGFGYVMGVQARIEGLDSRIVKTEYQNSIGIADRAEIHLHIERSDANNSARMDRTDAVINEINVHLASVDTNVKTLIANQPHH